MFARTLFLLLALTAAPTDLTLRGKECRIKTNLAAKVAKPIPKRIDRYCENFKRFYDGLGLEPKASNKVVIRVFATHEEFADFYHRSSPGKSPPAAYFSPSLNSVVSYHDPSNPYLRQVLFHETSHQYLNRYTTAAPKWANEGLAEYFEGWQLDPDGSLIKKRPPFYDLLVLQEALAEKKYLPPRELIQMKPSVFKDFRANYPALHGYLHYCTAWGLVWYMLEGPNDADRALFLDYLNRLCDDGERAAPFEPEDWTAFEERWKKFITGITIEPEIADDHVILAANLRAEAEYEKAIEQYEAALAKDPTTPAVRYWVGYCYKRRGRYEEAATHLERAVKDDEDDPRPLYLLARMSAGTDREDSEPDLAQALEYAEAASKRVKDKNPVYLSFVARCQHLAGDGKKAVKTMRKVLKLVKDEDEEVQASYERMLEEFKG